MYENVRLLFGLLIFSGLAINFIYQTIHTFKASDNNNDSLETIHTFKCRDCKQTYQLNREEARERIRLWPSKLRKETPKGHTQALRFVCPKCDVETFQYRVFDKNVTAIFKSVHEQLSKCSKEMMVDILLKGFIPFLIIMPLLGLLLP